MRDSLVLIITGITGIALMAHALWQDRGGSMILGHNNCSIFLLTFTSYPVRPTLACLQLHMIARGRVKATIRGTIIPPIIAWIGWMIIRIMAHDDIRAAGVNAYQPFVIDFVH
jgi:hypothetical protein